jgi:hypothetical protein
MDAGSTQYAAASSEHLATRVRQTRVVHAESPGRIRATQSIVDRLANVLIYHGPAVDYLDIAIWVTRDRAGGSR